MILLKKENNITLGTDFSYFNNKFTDMPVFMIGGMVRTFRRTSFVSENWFVTTRHDQYNYEDHPDEYYITAVISNGIRFVGEKMSVNLVFKQVLGKMGLNEFIFPGISYLDFVIYF